MTELADRRRAMRLVLRERRAVLSDEDMAAASMAVMARLARIPVLERAQLVGGYRGIRGEVDIDAALTLMLDRGAIVTVPRVDGERMDFLPWLPGAASIAGSFGIDEPVEGDPVPFSRHDVVLVPLVAFDELGQRLGQGAGFYDRAIAQSGIDRPLLIGVAHAFQQVESVPVEPWDMPLDAVVTEERIHEFRPGALE
ncbi:MAG: 5-formyltetrahydrofolate cyclo-ligase [Actinomycetota bacterium]